MIVESAADHHGFAVAAFHEATTSTTLTERYSAQEPS
jgi:hypothetical protein